MKKETDNPLNEEDDKNMDIFEEELLKIVAKSKLTPLGVAALLLKNAVTIYSCNGKLCTFGRCRKEYYSLMKLVLWYMFWLVLIWYIMAYHTRMFWVLGIYD